MSRSWFGGSDGRRARRNTSVGRAADGLALAAAPTFATMALLTALPGTDPATILCSASISPLHGMATMYLLMSAFHLGPWLKLVRRHAASV